jgi:hypothetical protein
MKIPFLSSGSVQFGQHSLEEEGTKSTKAQELSTLFF